MDQGKIVKSEHVRASSNMSSYAKRGIAVEHGIRIGSSARWPSSFIQRIFVQQSQP